MDFLDEDILECDNMRGLIQVILYGEKNSVEYIVTISYVRCVHLVSGIGIQLSDIPVRYRSIPVSDWVSYSGTVLVPA